MKHSLEEVNSLLRSVSREEIEEQSQAKAEWKLDELDTDQYVLSNPHFYGPDYDTEI